MAQHNDFNKPRFSKAYGFAIFTGALFLFSWVGQFIAQVFVVRNDALEHGEAFSWSVFWPEFLQATMENWQSEFLQLVWQAAGLALLFFWGSSQSKESDERIEEKLNRLLQERGIDPDEISAEVNKSLH